MSGIYLDHDAAAPPLESVRRAVADALEHAFAHPASLHAPGRAARAALERARSEVAQLFGTETGHVAFTAGGGDADRLAIELALAAHSEHDRDVIVLAPVEHPALLERLRRREAEGRCRLRLAPVGPDGRIEPEAIAPLLDERVALLAVGWANHETGLIAPVEALAKRAHACGALVLADAVQAAGRIPIEPAQHGVDLCAISGRKLQGPPGTGALWIARPAALGRRALARLAEHEQTVLDVPGACGLAAAVRHAVAQLDPARSAQLAALRDRLEALLCERIPGCKRNGAAAPRLPQTLSVRIPEIDGRELVRLLSERGIHVSSGAACASARHEPSNVLTALGLDARTARGALRISLGPDTTAAEIERAAEEIPRAVTRLRRLARGPLPARARPSP